MTRTNALGDYLRARRELVDPRSVGLRVTGVRRTPGLRREEVATLAGISADYYLRLEQGRDRNPSAQVLEALASVLDLDDAGRDYLLSLSTARPRPRTARRELVPPSILQLLDVIDLPCFVEGRSFDVLAANPLATALDATVAVGENRVRSVFLDPRFRDRHPEWESILAPMVASFRASIGTGPDQLADPRTVQLVGELSLASEQFRRLWARHDVKPIAGGPVRMDHPDVGPLELRREKLPIGESEGQVLAILHAEAGSASALGLDRLRAAVAGVRSSTA